MALGSSRSGAATEPQAVANSRPVPAKTLPDRAPVRDSRPPLWQLQPALRAPQAAFDPTARAIDVASEAMGRVAGSPDLEANIDVQITQEIIDKANELGTPQAMYEFVRNECAFQPYYGSRKGSVETLRQRAGNDYDLASLLIALLRASGIPARYADGIVEMPTARATSWLAVDRGDIAGSILFTNGMEGTYLISGSPDNIVAVQCRRVWVEAYLPRGFASRAWVPLDPAFSMKDVHQGIDIPEEMALNAQDFVDEYYDPSDPGVTLPRPETMHEILKEQIADYVDANYPGMTLDDVMRGHETIPEKLGLLPSSLPYKVLSRDAVYSEIPAARRYRVRFHLHDGATNLIDYTANLPTIAGRRVTIDYVGATPADQAIIDANEGIYQTPPSSVDLKPVLRIDAAVVGTGAAGVGMGLLHESDVHFLAPVNGQGLPQNVVPAIFNDIITGASQAIAIGVEGASESLALTPPEDDPEGTLSLLYETGMDYLAHCRNDDIELGRLMHSFVTTDVTSAILENVVKVTYNGFGVPQTFDWAGLRVDADRSIVGVWPVDRYIPGETEDRDFLLIGGANGSGWEHHIFERGFDQDSVSTIKILELAIDTGVTVYKRWSTLPLPANTQPASVRNALQNAILNGNVVTFPANPMTVGTVGTGQWTGTGWIDQDPDTGAAGYLISGGNNGGATFEFWPPEFIDLQEGDRRVVNVEIEITEPDMDSPDSDSIFTRDNEQTLTFKYLLHVTYDDASTATLGPYTKTTRNTTKTFSPGNYTFHVWIARFSWFSFGIWHAERKVSIVGVLIREDDGTPAGKDPPKFVPVNSPVPPYATPFVQAKAVVIPEKAPNNAALATGYQWSGGSKLNFPTPTQQSTKIEGSGGTASGAVDDQNVDVVVTLLGGKQQNGYAKFNFAQGGQDEKHKMTAIKFEFVTPKGDPVAAADTMGEGRNEYTYSAASPGTFDINFQAKVMPAAADLNKIKDDVSFMAGAVAADMGTWAGANPNGRATAVPPHLEAKITFSGLPASNGDFGRKTATLLWKGFGIERTFYEVFFPRGDMPVATNNPGGTDPNWFYYWTQLYATASTVRHDAATATPGATPAMTTWSYAAARDKNLMVFGAGNPTAGRPYGVGEFFSGVDWHVCTMIHEGQHITQIATADPLVPSAGADSFQYGWSFNQGTHNHWTKGPDGQWGRAGVDDDGNGTVDDAKPLPPFEPGRGDDVNLSKTVGVPAGYNNWPDAWALPVPNAGPSPIESQAINASDTAMNEHDYADRDWADPGKQHLTLNNWAD